VLPLSNRFKYYLLDLPFRIHSTTVSFQMELEHLMVHEAPWSPILSGVVGVDALSLCAFFRTLQGSGLGHHSRDAEHDRTPHEHHHANSKTLTKETHELTPRDQGPCSHETTLGTRLIANRRGERT
jgi:hypothetical protein